jgi:serine kinase of HPr protein (carbohydrate metabolism regulator)
MSKFSESSTPADSQLAKCQIHGVLMEVYGCGILILGESGVGKTACALELIERGHSLIADDAVEIFAAESHLVGRAPEITRSLVHIRGAGITNVEDLFHETVVRYEYRIDACVEIREADSHPSPYPNRGFLLTIPWASVPPGTPARTADGVEAVVRCKLKHSR